MDKHEFSNKQNKIPSKQYKKEDKKTAKKNDNIPTLSNSQIVSVKLNKCPEFIEKTEWKVYKEQINFYFCHFLTM